MLALVSLVFFTTCGGAFGLEPLIGAVGPGWAVILILVAIRLEPTHSRLAMYPVLFVSYLTFLIPAIASSADSPQSETGAMIRWLIAILVIGSGMVLNLRGAREVGRSAKVGAYLVLG